MATLPKVPNVEIRDTGTPKGRGVYALQGFQWGEVVEICAVIAFVCPYNDLPAELQEYVFNWSDLDSSVGENMQAIAMGYGGMYNCDNPANMRYEAVTEGNQFLQRFVAAREIRVGDELTVNYSGKGGAADSEGNRWFQGRGIVPIFTAQPSGQNRLESIAKLLQIRDCITNETPLPHRRSTRLAGRSTLNTG